MKLPPSKHARCSDVSIVDVLLNSARYVMLGLVDGCEARYWIVESAAAIHRVLYSPKRDWSYTYIFSRYS